MEKCSDFLIIVDQTLYIAGKTDGSIKSLIQMLP